MKKRVIITGASRGIGSATALRLASEGYLVGINYVSGDDKAEEVLEEMDSCGYAGYLLKFDVSDREQAREVLEADLVERGDLWGVVCNAGVSMDAPFPALEEEMWDKVIGTNLGGFFNVLKPLVMPMVTARGGGRIVLMSSVSAISGNRGQVNYAASKAGIGGAARSLALELAKREITVNVVAPGIIETDMTVELNKAETSRIIPMRRWGRPQEVAALTAFLVSSEAGYITGQTISINGGMI